jgi:membrane protease YdiL (CAAX protease family)
MARDRKSKTPEAEGLWSRYLRQSARPLPALAFVVPLMLVYEVGVVWLGRDAIRNGADVLMRQLLDVLGFGQYFLLPVATCAILLAWHHVRRDPWRFSPRVLLGMFVESIVWALVLLAAWRLSGDVQRRLFAAVSEHNGSTAELARLVAYCGAGLYEELLFRLILLSAVMGIIRMAGGTPKATAITAVVVTSLVFAAVHYQPFTPHGDALQVSSFLFRFLAGAVFAVLYVRRGFGVATGTHAFYDVSTQLL